VRSSSALQPDDVKAGAIRSLLSETGAAALPTWLENRRWFADKGRDIRRAEIEDAIVERVGSDWLALAVARVAFADGGVARYLLPFALTESPGEAETITRVESGAVAGVVIDTTDRPWFGGWLLDQLAGGPDQAHGNWNFAAHPAGGAVISAARGTATTAVRAEQSNSSLRFDDILILKLFRRLQPGLNPDEEVLRALADVNFARVPRFLGSVTWRSQDAATYAVGLVQGFVSNVGDGWTWMLQRLAAVAAGTVDPRGDRFVAERLLGQRTGELHVALGTVPEPGFAPETTDSTAVAADIARTRAAIDETIRLLRAEWGHLPESIATRLPAAIEGLRELAERVNGYQDELGTRRIRVHGDYHLGQTLRTPDGDWVIIDFEGEPARSLEERRQRASVLKDVAGMLRSFAYARGAVERAKGSAADPAASGRLEDWEMGARRAFLEGYRQTLATSETRFVPEDGEGFARALAAWELDKALYEVAYEARNRPDWLELPLRSLLPDLLGQAADTAGGAPA
jgi:maltose alpha-D-glucosyltransferase/alpha-amylase